MKGSYILTLVLSWKLAGRWTLLAKYGDLWYVVVCQAVLWLTASLYPRIWTVVLQMRLNRLTSLSVSLPSVINRPRSRGGAKADECTHLTFSVTFQWLQSPFWSLMHNVVSLEKGINNKTQNSLKLPMGWTFVARKFFHANFTCKFWAWSYNFAYCKSEWSCHLQAFPSSSTLWLLHIGIVPKFGGLRSSFRPVDQCLVIMTYNGVNVHPRRRQVPNEQILWESFDLEKWTDSHVPILFEAIILAKKRAHSLTHKTTA